MMGIRACYRINEALCSVMESNLVCNFEMRFSTDLDPLKTCQSPFPMTLMFFKLKIDLKTSIIILSTKSSQINLPKKKLISIANQLALFS